MISDKPPPPRPNLKLKNTPGRFGRVTLAYTVLVPEEYRGIDILRCVVTHAQLEAPGLRVYIRILKYYTVYTGKYTKEEPLDVVLSGF